VNRYYLLAFATLMAFAACSTDSYEGSLQTNQPPQVWLSAAPPEGSVSKYTVHLYCGGCDPDG
jgi:hypothetical protein